MCLRNLWPLKARSWNWAWEVFRKCIFNSLLRWETILDAFPALNYSLLWFRPLWNYFSKVKINVTLLLFFSLCFILLIISLFNYNFHFYLKLDISLQSITTLLFKSLSFSLSQDLFLSETGIVCTVFFKIFNQIQKKKSWKWNCTIDKKTAQRKKFLKQTKFVHAR